MTAQSEAEKVTASLTEAGLTEIRNFQKSSGEFFCTLSENEPTGWDGKGPYWKHFVGDGATAEEAREAALQQAHLIKGNPDNGE